MMLHFFGLLGFGVPEAPMFLVGSPIYQGKSGHSTKQDSGILVVI